MESVLSEEATANQNPVAQRKPFLYNWKKKVGYILETVGTVLIFSAFVLALGGVKRRGFGLCFWLLAILC